MAPVTARNAFLLLLLLASVAAFPATDTLDAAILPADSGAVSVRDFDGERLAELSADPDFDYSEPEQAPVNIVQRFLRWLGQVMETVFPFAGSPLFWKITLYLLIALVLGYTVLRLIGAEFTGAFGAPERGAASPMAAQGERLVGRDFPAEIAAAEREGRYRSAVRLHYLAVLQRLGEAGLIQWRPEKTNRDYLMELGVAALRTPFADLTRIFDVAFYGHADLDGAAYREVRETFVRFRRDLGEPR